MYKSLLKKIEDKKAIVGIIGLGYVGLPLVLEFNASGFDIIGFDLDDNKCKSLLNSKTYIKHIPNEKLEALNKSKKFKATSDFSQMKKCDVLIICVPTPLNANREPDLTYVENTVREIRKTLRKGQLISLESTTYPGTTDELMLPILEESKLKVGQDFFLAYSPEREDPGNLNFNTRTIPKVIGGTTKKCGNLVEKLYSFVVDQVVRVSGSREAEMTKLLENIFRSVNIALVNELKIVAHKMDIDIWQVIDAAKTKPFGFMPFYPGPGIGGHCIPIDPFYLAWKAREYNISTRFIELAGEINSSMPTYTINKTAEALNQKGKALKGSRIMVLGAAYKTNVDDMRESPSLELIELLRAAGSKVEYSDPHIPKLPPTRKHKLDMKSKPLTKKNLEKTDAIIISTSHSAFDYDFIVEHAPLIIDARNATKDVKKFRNKIVMA